MNLDAIPRLKGIQDLAAGCVDFINMSADGKDQIIGDCCNLTTYINQVYCPRYSLKHYGMIFIEIDVNEKISGEIWLDFSRSGIYWSDAQPWIEHFHPTGLKLSRKKFLSI